MAVQSLYRRYRPRRFADVRGQDHVVAALRNAVANGTEGHAYLFSGPRGTGKTSTARIFAKALNCLAPVEGEPCLECESCLAIEAGNSYDLFELDAASNNGVDAMRDLIVRASVGSPGRTKVYILDEVHMLSAAASNALLKTLEEPPDHVKFVLATTDPQKVLSTIKSRTQHFEFGLLTAAELADYCRWVIDDAGLSVPDGAVEHVVAVGRGSARDTLSALDQIVAAGRVPQRTDSVDGILTAVAGGDAAAALVALDDAIGAGADPRVVAENLMSVLRDAFLIAVGVDLAHLSDDQAAAVAAHAEAIGAPRLTAALEGIGHAVVDMRAAPEPRIPLEVALLSAVAARRDSSSPPPAGNASSGGGGGEAASVALVRDLAALRRRVDDLEAALAATRSARAKAPAPVPPPRQQPPSRRPGGGVGGGESPDRPPAVADTGPANSEADTTTTLAGDAVAAGSSADIDAVRAAFAGPARDALGRLERALFARAEVVELDGSTVVVALENEPLRERAAPAAGQVGAALSRALGRPVDVRLVIGSPPRVSGRDARAPRSTPQGGGPDSEPHPGGSAELEPLPPEPTDGDDDGDAGSLASARPATASKGAQGSAGRPPPPPPQRSRRDRAADGTDESKPTVRLDPFERARLRAEGRHPSDSVESPAPRSAGAESPPPPLDRVEPRHQVVPLDRTPEVRPAEERPAAGAGPAAEARPAADVPSTSDEALPDDDAVDMNELRDATDDEVGVGGGYLIQKHFPGAVLVSDGSTER